MPRQVAKIALGWAIGAVGYGRFINTVSPIILGDEPDWSLAVGDLDGWLPANRDPGRPSYFAIPISDDRAVFGVELSLFNNPGFPRYRVVVGEQFMKIGENGRTIQFGAEPFE